MPVKQLETPCWQPCAPGEKPRNEGPHWLTREDAARHADPGQQFPEPCWIAVCDGLPGEPCGEELESTDDGWTIHANPSELPDFAIAEGWQVTPDDGLRCFACIDEASEVSTDA